ncbi:MAG: CapA family protein [Firmicutes bacterium]|nr:CapA family protein [Bacillota bacterium]
MKLLIGADFVPTQSNARLFAEGDAAALFGEELTALLREVDFRIFNLECPLTDSGEPIAKKGPHLSGAAAAVRGYAAAGADLLTLANNHIFDLGAEGLRSTLRVLDEQGIAHAGAGENLAEAAAPYRLELGGKPIAVVACAEHEFSIAGEDRPGANPFDPLETPDLVAALKREYGRVIVLYHGGKEYYRYPSPLLQKRCRKLVEKGAGLVVCQHSHCIGCAEEYKGGTIVYGQGNFLFDHGDNEFRNTGLLVAADEDLRVSFIPLVKQGAGVRLAQGQQAEEILAAFRQRGEQMRAPGFLEQEYEKLADSLYGKYVRELAGPEGALFRALNTLTGGRLRRRRLNRRFGRKQLLALKNDLECEAHSELLGRAVDRQLDRR